MTEKGVLCKFLNNLYAHDTTRFNHIKNDCFGIYLILTLFLTKTGRK